MKQEIIKVQRCPKCRNFDQNFVEVKKKIIVDERFDDKIPLFFRCQNCSYEISITSSDKKIGEKLVEYNVGLYGLLDCSWSRRIKAVIGKRKTAQLMRAMIIVGNCQFEFNSKTGQNPFCH